MVGRSSAVKSVTRCTDRHLDVGDEVPLRGRGPSRLLITVLHVVHRGEQLVHGAVLAGAALRIHGLHQLRSSAFPHTDLRQQRICTHHVE